MKRDTDVFFLDVANLSLSLALFVITAHRFWNWYVAPVCHLSRMSVAGSFGLTAAYLVFFAQWSASPDDKRAAAIDRFRWTVAKYSTAWVTAGLIHLAGGI